MLRKGKSVEEGESQVKPYKPPTIGHFQLEQDQKSQGFNFFFFFPDGDNKDKICFFLFPLNFNSGFFFFFFALVQFKSDLLLPCNREREMQSGAKTKKCCLKMNLLAVKNAC